MHRPSLFQRDRVTSAFVGDALHQRFVRRGIGKDALDIGTEVIERLTTAGKSVAVASLALVTLEREVAQTRRLAEKAELAEANDLSALRVLAGKPHLVGPFVNVYNGATARLLAKRGAIRICLGPELPATSIASTPRKKAT